MHDDTTRKQGDVSLKTKEYMAECACFNLRRASRIITSLYNEHLKESGILITQLPPLAVLREAGPLPVTRLSVLIEMDRTTLARNLLPLKKLGLVSESRGTDRRNKVLAITEKGKEAVSKAIPLWKNAQEDAGRRLGEDRIAALLSHLLQVQSVDMSVK